MVELQAVTENYKRSLTQAEGTFKKTVASVRTAAAGLASTMGGTLANAANAFLAAFAVQRLYQFVRSTIDTSSALLQQAERLKISTDQLQKYQAAAAEAHISSEEFSNQLFVFSRNVGEASRGQGDLYKVLQLNKIAIRDTTGEIRPLNAIFDDYIDLLSRSTSAATTAKLSQIAFGRSSQEIGTFAAHGSKGVKAIGDEAERTGRILGGEILSKTAALDRQFIAMEEHVGVAFKTLAISAGPAVLKVIDAFDKLVAFFEANPLVAKILGFALVGGRVGGLAGAAVGGAVALVDSIIPNGPQKILDVQKEARWNQAFAPQVNSKFAMPGLNEAAARAGATARAGAAGAGGVAAGLGAEPQLPPAPAGPANEFETATRAIKEQTVALTLEGKTLGESTFEIEKQKAALTLSQAAAQAHIPVTKALAAQIDDLSSKYADQIVLLQQLQLTQARVEQAAVDAFDAVKSSLGDLILHGKSFNDVLAGLLDRFAEIALNNVFDTLFTPKTGGGAGGPLGGVFNFIGSLFGGGFTGGHARGGTIPVGSYGTASENEIVRATPRGAIIIPTGRASGARNGEQHHHWNFDINVAASGNDETDGNMVRQLEGMVRSLIRDEHRQQSKLRGALNPL